MCARYSTVRNLKQMRTKKQRMNKMLIQYLCWHWYQGLRISYTLSFDLWFCLSFLFLWKSYFFRFETFPEASNVTLQLNNWRSWRYLSFTLQFHTILLIRIGPTRSSLTALFPRIQISLYFSFLVELGIHLLVDCIFPIINWNYIFPISARHHGLSQNALLAPKVLSALPKKC